MFDFLLILLLIVANGVFALSEIAVVSARKTRIEPAAREGDKNAQTALQLLESPTNFLSTVQIGITLIGVLAGALSGRTLAARLAPLLAQVEWLAPYSTTISLALVVTLITYLSLVIGELVPKRLALNDPEGIAIRVARPMYGLSRVALPLVHLLSASTEIAVRLLGVKPSDEPPVTEEELKSLLKQGTQAGVFEQSERQIVQRALDLDDLRVTSLMTPRPDITWLDLDDSAAEIRRKIIESGFSRLPVIDGDRDQVLGVARTTELLAHYTEKQTGEESSNREPAMDLRQHIYDPVFIPSSASPVQAVELFRQFKLHTIMVVNEYGSVVGLITPTDILEFIVGQLPSVEFSWESEPGIVQRDENSWLVDGMISIHDLAAALPEDNPCNGFDTRAQTLNGFVMQGLARIPGAGDVLEWSNCRLEVVDMDGNRVDKVLLTLEDVNAEDANGGETEAGNPNTAHESVEPEDAGAGDGDQPDETEQPD